jgi:hypothetical protein
VPSDGTTKDDGTQIEGILDWDRYGNTTRGTLGRQ